MTENLRQSNIQVNSKRRRGGKKRTQVTEEAAVFLQPKEKPNDNKFLPQGLQPQKMTNKQQDLMPSKGIETYQENRSYVNNLLRMFDLNSDFGPCIGLSRQERWKRASALGLHPPPEIKSFLADPLCPQECLFSKMCV